MAKNSIDDEWAEFLSPEEFLEEPQTSHEYLLYRSQAERCRGLRHLFVKAYPRTHLRYQTSIYHL